MEQRLISVIIPVYKVEERLLRKSIESVINQTYQNWELLLIEDGSPDECGKICDEYSNEKIKVIHKKNGGVSSARNVGLIVSSGEYITFLDSDDFIDKNYLKYLLQLIVSNNSDIGICCCNYVDGKNIENTKIVKKQLTLEQIQAIEALCYMKQYFFGNEFTAVWGKLYRREIIGNIQFDERMSIGEDFVFNYRCFSRSRCIAVGNERLYYYFVSNSGLMHGKFNIKRVTTLESLSELSRENHGKYTDAVISRLINIGIILFLMIPDGEYYNEKNKIIKFINQNRLSVIKNVKVRKKVRISLILSYLGYDLMAKIFAIINNRK